MIAATEPEFSAEQVGWRFTLGAVVLVKANNALPIITPVNATDQDPGHKAGIAGPLRATPFNSKFVAIAIMGRPAYFFLSARSTEAFADASRARRPSNPFADWIHRLKGPHLP